MRSNSSSALFLFSSSSVRTLLTHATGFSELTPVQTDADVGAHTCATARVHHVNRPGLAPLRLRSRSQAVARPSPPGMIIELSSVDLSNQLNCDAVCDSKCNLIFLSTHASSDRETRQARDSSLLSCNSTVRNQPRRTKPIIVAAVATIARTDGPNAVAQFFRIQVTTNQSPARPKRTEVKKYPLTLLLPGQIALHAGRERWC